MLLLDTSILIRQQKGDVIVKKSLSSLSKRFPAKPSVTFINIFEYFIGIKQLTKRKNEATKFLENFDIINTTENTAEVMASLRFKYDNLGVQFSLADLIVASLAIENNMALVTSDKDFQNIKELKLELIS
jgi:predicted nucleic acid-binding protein